MRLADESEEETQRKKAGMYSEFFNVLIEINRNEHFVPLILQAYLVVQKMYTKNKQLEYSTEENYSTKPLMSILRNIMFASLPLEIEKFTGLADYVTNEEDLRDNFITDYCEYRKENKMVHLKKRIADAIDHRSIDTSVLWYESEVFSELSEGWKSRLDPLSQPNLYTMDTATNLPKLVRLKFSNFKFFKYLPQIVPEFTAAKRDKNLVLIPLLQFVILYLNNLQTGADTQVEEFLKIMHTESASTPIMKSFIQQISAFRNKDLLSDPFAEFKRSDSANNLSVSKDIVNEKFKRKKEKIMNRMDKLKSNFLKNMAKDSESFVSSVIQISKDDIVCSISKEILTNSKTYYLLGQLHSTNVSPN